MKIQPITTSPKLSFCNSKKREYVDKAITLQDLYEVEDRINNKIQKQNEILGKTLYSMTNLIYLAPYITAQDETDRNYQDAKHFSEILKRQ